jgi:hypothetical protein
MQGDTSPTALVVSNVFGSIKQYQKAFKRWKTTKYVSATHKNHMIGILRAREKKGKKTGFLRYQRPYAIANLLRHIRDQNFSEDFLNSLELCSEGSQTSSPTFGFY